MNMGRAGRTSSVLQFSRRFQIVFQKRVYVMLLLFALFCFALSDITCDPKPGTPVNSPIGTGRGVTPGRVAWNYQKDACSWDGSTNYWFNKEFINETIVEDMMDGVILSIGNQKKGGDLPTAWNNIFENFKSARGQTGGYVKGEKFAIKLNLNVNIGYDTLSNSNSVSPQVLKQILNQLVNTVGVAQEDIYVYDASRWIQINFWDMLKDDYGKVNYYDAQGGEGSYNYTKQVLPDMDTMFYFSDQRVAGTNESKLPQILTDATYLIQLDAFRGHNLAAFTESGKNWFGSIYRPDCDCPYYKGLPGHWCPISLHKWVNVTGDDMGGDWIEQRPMGVYNPLVDLLGHDSTANGKGLLFIVDGLYGGNDELSTPPIKFSMKPFNNDWSCSVFASMDSMALDSVAFDFLRNEKNQEYAAIGCGDNYLHEGALAPNSPSGVKYFPSGHVMKSLGVHEHWNNADDKEYTRNLGTGKGIELVKVHES